MEHPSIIFKIVCPDRPGLVSLLTSWISNYGGNIKHSDHHTDQDAGLFLSRIEWNSNNEFFNRDEIYKEFEKIADEVNGKFNVNYSDEIPNVAIFVSKQNHCLIDLLWRVRNGELKMKVPLIISNHSDFPVITAENEISTDEEEIRQMAKIGSQKGFIEADEAAMIFKVFQLNDLKAKDLMTPRVSAPCLDGSSNIDEISKLIMSDSSPWWVILGDKVDKIQGVVKREKILAALINGQNKKLLSEICEPVDYIPEMIKADQLLTKFDKNHKGVKVVVDEFGGFVGIIGAEAVLSVLAGWWKNKS